MTIYLIGFMGSGKSTVGKILSNLMGSGYVDTDALIEEKYGPIPKIFSTYGENTFRSYETSVLKEVPNGAAVISTGGGIVERDENISFMKDNGVIVYLHTSFEQIQARLHNDTGRPLWNRDIQEKKNLFQKRIEIYRDCAGITITTDDKEPIMIAEEIKEELNWNKGINVE
ncbi:shikimate kinase [Virgibacillus siamensis]|uniref:shikimate kinase n=1 Tax=Virgibacillus siamensis TaxID=480071 RepID=UPI0009849D61|nr:shikimate kinase [Virgibacillus siamensis]